MNRLLNDLNNLPKLLTGFLVMAFGLVLTRQAGLGMSPWGVFHLDISEAFDIKVGIGIQLVGGIILILSIVFLRTKIGIGTILNVLLVGFFFDKIEEYFIYLPSNLFEEIGLLLLGLFFTTFGRSLYISTTLGPGPRDGLFVGVTRITKLDVKYVKPIIEIIVLVIGVILGGTFGVGTIVLVILSGYLVDYFFQKLSFDPKSAVQSNLLLYFAK